ncbi:MAG: phytanoyl-CoA dioxygenase family protein, partial [Candidatus Hydrogenedentes bacterium]|nr:phytanoyl-CoA dioxygenase family protein [Candidatus Hydrogenedentota bacterium]
MTYVLTEFSQENGATAFVPGSHITLRAPPIRMPLLKCRDS